jgi:hypothetical protein
VNRFTTILVLVALALGVAQTASARERLKMQNACPSDKPIACLTAEISFNDLEAKDVNYVVQSAPLSRPISELLDPIPETDSFGDDRIVASATVTGRLNGGRANAFTLEFPPTEAHEDVHHMSVAFLGRSSADNVVILTDRGPLELPAQGFSLSYGDFTLVDAKNWRIVAKYLDLAEDGYLISSPTDIAVWNEKTKTCVEAPTDKPGMLKINDSACKGRDKGNFTNVVDAKIRLGDMRKVFPYVGLVGSEDENALSSEFGGDGGYHSVFRIKNTNYLIVTIVWDDC